MRGPKIVALVSAFCLSGNLFAANFKKYSTDNEWSSSAINSLGGVGLLSENTVDRFFSDPSSLAESKPAFVLQWAGIHGSYSQDLMDTVDDFQKMLTDTQNSSGDSSGTKTTIKALDALEKVFGRRLTGNFNFNLMSFKIGGFSLIPYASSQLEGEARIPSLPRASVLGDIYGGLGLGYARSFGTKFEAGLNIRPGARVFVDYKVDVSTIGDFATSATDSTTSSTSATSTEAKFGSTKIGMYVPVDFSLALKPWPIARFTLVMRDFGGAPALSSMTDAGNPPTYPMRVALGATVQALQKGNHTIMLGSQLQDLLNLASDSAFWYRWQWAGQYRYKLPFRAVTTFGLNTGLQAGYPAVGVFLDLFLFKIEYARYTREAGYYIGQRPEIRHSFRTWSQLTF